MPKDPGNEIQDPRTGDSVVGDGRPAGAVALAEGRQWFGHPRGLSTLFFTEMWERFSYYGMRAILVLFMTTALTADNAGMGLQVGLAAAIYGLYTFFVYVLSLPGGWVADNLWGQKKAVFVGGVIIMLGHISLAIPTDITFYLGLALVVIGTGLLKPNVSTMVADLYPEGGARRDAGFSIFYMGINIGAFAGTALVGLVGESYNFHWGFSLAAVGMALGLVQYKLGWNHLGTAGDLRTTDPPDAIARKSRMFYTVAGGFLLFCALLGGLIYTGTLPITIQQLAQSLGVVVVMLAVGFFVYLHVAGGLVGDEKKRLWVIFALFVFAALFWMGFEQAGSSMNLFAFELTDRTISGIATNPILSSALIAASLFGVLLLSGIIAWMTSASRQGTNIRAAFAPALTIGLMTALFALLGYLFYRGSFEYPASWLQNVNPFFIIVLAPVVGGLWVWLAKRNANPSIPVKFALGLFGLAAGFFVLAWGAANASATNLVSPAWLVVAYFFHTVGELCLSPVGLSSMTKLAPEGRMGQMMGIWFIASALGNLMAGLTAGQLETLPPADLFRNVAIIVGVAGLVALLVAPVVRRVAGRIE